MHSESPPVKSEPYPILSRHFGDGNGDVLPRYFLAVNPVGALGGTALCARLGASKHVSGSRSQPDSLATKQVAIGFQKPHGGGEDAGRTEGPSSLNARCSGPAENVENQVAKLSAE